MKVADNLLLYPDKETLWVFIIELKAGRGGDAHNQIRASYELSRYICNTARRLLNYPTLTVKYRGIIFSSQQVQKLGTKAGKQFKTDNQIPELELVFKQTGNMAYKLNNFTSG